MTIPAAGRRIALSDAHGHLDELLASLRAVDVVDGSGGWVGGRTRAWVLGDYLDRGTQGLGVVDLVRRLETQAREAGGEVVPLLGNHELQFLAALHFGDSETAADGKTSWLANWRRYGGVDTELHDVTDAQVEWMTGLPLVALDGDDLLMHSDTEAYLELGSTVEEINAAGAEVLSGREAGAWADLHRILTQRGEFTGPGPRGRMLRQLGGQRLVHGHNTLIGGFGLDAETAASPYVYGDGQVLAIDGGVFEGGAVLVAHL